jgi:hypothetical protein
MAEADPRRMRVSAGGATSVQGLKGPKTMLGARPLEAATTLTAGCLDDLELAVERVYLGRDIEDSRVRVVPLVASELGDQSPVVRAASQLCGLMVGR